MPLCPSHVLVAIPTCARHCTEVLGLGIPYGIQKIASSPKEYLAYREVTERDLPSECAVTINRIKPDMQTGLWSQHLEVKVEESVEDTGDT